MALNICQKREIQKVRMKKKTERDGLLKVDFISYF